MDKYFVFDLDGTLLDDKGYISEYSKNIISQIKKVKENGIILASGRSIHAVNIYVSDLKLDENDYLITSDGCCLYDIHSQKIVDLGYFIQADFKLLRSIFGGFAFRAYSENENYVVIFNYFQKLYYIVRNTIAFALKKPRFKILLKKSQEDFDVIRLRKILINSHKNHSILSSNYTVHKFSSKSIEILPVGVSKYDALMKFCSYQFFDINKLFYFGNDSNDIECFYNLKNTIAPANSSTLIQSLARFVCDSNNSSGPCKYISEFLLGSDNENTNS